MPARKLMQLLVELAREAAEKHGLQFRETPADATNWTGRAVLENEQQQRVLFESGDYVVRCGRVGFGLLGWSEEVTPGSGAETETLCLLASGWVEDAVALLTQGAS